jgi:hypothetical protein
MNTKIIVALVIGIALIGLTGVASASYYGNWIETQTEITGTHFTSESHTAVSGMPVQQTFSSVLSAEIKYPIFPQYDFSADIYDISGTDYSTSNSATSSPSGSTTAVTIDSPSDVRGSLTFYNCALLGTGIGMGEVSFPQDITEPDTGWWSSSHRAGATYLGQLNQEIGIYWP